jgi:hypothetical protein
VEATLIETQMKVREAFIRILGSAPETQQLGKN